MRWEDERYVRVYTRNTPDWIALPWEGRAVFYELCRNVDRAGFVALGKSGMRGVAGLLLMPLEIVEVGIAALLDDGCVVRVDGGLLIRNFIEAQETPQSDRARKRAQRERDRNNKRDAADAQGQRVTERDETGQFVTQRDHASQNVTESHEVSRGDQIGHAESQEVTLCCAVPCCAVPEDPPLPPATGGSASVQSSEPDKPAKRTRNKPSPMGLPGVGTEAADDVFAAYVGAWQRVVGKGAAPVLDDKRRRRIRRWVDEGIPVDRLKAAAAGIFDSEWHTSPENRSHLTLEVALRDGGQIEKFSQLFAEAEAKRAPPSPVERPAWINQAPRPRFKNLMILREAEAIAAAEGDRDPFEGLTNGMLVPGGADA